MNYGQLVELYFSRSNALQWYWTIYVVVIGGLLAFSSLRQRPDRITGVLVTILYVCFAYKNLGAIRDVTYERYAILKALKDAPEPAGDVIVPIARQHIEPVFTPPEFEGVKRFHVACDVLTVAALWAMELRRRRAHNERLASGAIGTSAATAT